MKAHKFMATLLATTLLTSNLTAETAPENNEKAPLIGRANIQSKGGLLTPEILHSFGRVSDVQVSPDGKKLLYGVTYVSIEQNKTNRELFTISIDGTDKRQITQTPTSERNAVWISGGKKIAFIAEGQIWTMDANGTNRTQISHFEGSVDGFAFSPDEKKVLFVRNVKYGMRTSDRYPDLQKSSGRIVDDLMYKHWDTWVEEIPHPFVADFDGNQVSQNAIDILQGEPFESPMLPFGGMEQLAWSPDSKQIAYTCRKKTGRKKAISTNSDIYLYNLADGTTRNLTEGMMGYDTNPSFSPDGTQLAWLSMERDGYESDKSRLFVQNLTTGKKADITQHFDNNVDAFAWNADGKSIYTICTVRARMHLYKADLKTNTLAAITKGDFDYSSVKVADGKIVATRRSISAPDEIFTVNSKTGEATELSFENKHILSQLTMGKVEERLVKTTNGEEMLVWVILPPNFDKTKKYPALLYCQGGPQSAVSQFWSYRWNFQIMAANGYIVVAPNRHGLPGFGQKWNEQISGDYGGQNMQDYLSAIDEIAKEPYVDENRLGCTGASYGGFSTYWLAGNHNKRFKAFLAHAGIFNLETQYLETEELWFANWDLGGAPWDKNNAIAQKTYRTSPHLQVEKWDTPIMTTVGEKDYRILASQGMMAFNAAQLRGIPSRLLVYPDENHWITKPQNSVLFQREFFRWFDSWLKPEAK